MEPNWENYWAKARKLGVYHFVLLRGTALGVLMTVLLVLVPRWFDMVEADSFSWISLAMFMLLGYLAGYLLWWANERSYKILVARKNEQREHE